MPNVRTTLLEKFGISSLCFQELRYYTIQYADYCEAYKKDKSNIYAAVRKSSIERALKLATQEHPEAYPALLDHVVKELKYKDLQTEQPAALIYELRRNYYYCLFRVLYRYE